MSSLMDGKFSEMTEESFTGQVGTALYLAPELVTVQAKVIYTQV